MSHAKANNTTTGSQACAACKYQRRKCASNCPLAPYFPPDHQKQFLNAHRLFGVSNIMKILRNLDPSEKTIAMKSMIFQANVRANDPIGGCYRIIRELQCQIEHGKAELELVLHQLAVCRAQAAAAAAARTQIHVQDPNAIDPLITYNSMLPINEYGQQTLHIQPQQIQQQQLLEYDGYDSYQSQGYNVQDCPSVKVDIEASSSCSSSMHGKQPFVDECEDIKPLIGMFDERLPVPFDSKESIQCSDKVVLKEDVASIQHEQEHDLKGAASLFSLTNCNG
ncbi:hypothetical protein L1049_018717 [Liquidambar formosana]|uniref:LOB domain-containing protein n=1 Tax=Liquidambar formosana TaxID=63359 RepID=A0AAP0RB29_LIQFO